MASSPATDVVVVGGGAIGCACALRLAQAGLSVALIERGEAGGEATWAAGGILGAQMESSGPGPMLDLCLASRARWEAFAGDLHALSGIDVAYRACGVLELAFTEEDEEHLLAQHEWQTAAGLRAELVSAQLCRRKGGSPRALSGLFLEGDGRVDNRLLGRALRVAAERAGVHFVKAEARSIALEGGAVSGVSFQRADGEGGRIDCGRALVASGAWSALLPGAQVSPRAVRPVRGQMIALALRPPFETVLGSPGGYAIPRGDDRVLVGATVEEVGFDKSQTPEGLARMREVAATLSPALAAAPIVESWAGLRPGSADGLPLLGAPASGPRGLLVATGHFRNGILLTPITAELVRDLAAGRAPALDLAPFAPDRAALAAAPRR